MQLLPYGLGLLLLLSNMGVKVAAFVKEHGAEMLKPKVVKVEKPKQSR